MLTHIPLWLLAAAALAGEPLAISPPVWKPGPTPPDPILAGLKGRCGEALQASLALSRKKWPSGPDGVPVFLKNGEAEIRSPCGQARVLAWGAFLGLGSPDECLAWKTESVRLIRGLVRAHVANGGVWGDEWQSALWMANLARAAWVLGDSLPPDDRLAMAKALAHEADRFIEAHAQGWKAGQKMGGDTKGEENAWTTGSLILAAAMLRDHPHHRTWLRQAVSYAMTAVAMERDLADATPANGRPVREWVTAWCLSPEGMVANHGIYPHPDYTRASMSGDMQAVVLTLAGMPVPVALRHNHAFIYRNLVERVWPSPPYAAAGPIYQADGSIAWPGKGEAERAREVSAYAAIDLGQQILGLAAGPSAQAAEWERRHIDAGAGAKQGSQRVNNGIDSGALTHYLHRMVLLSGAIRFSDEPAAAGLAP